MVQGPPENMGCEHSPSGGALANTTATMISNAMGRPTEGAMIAGIQDRPVDEWVHLPGVDSASIPPPSTAPL